MEHYIGNLKVISSPFSRSLGPSKCKGDLSLSVSLIIFLSFEFPTLSWAEDELRSLSDTPMARCLSVHPNGMRGNTDHKGCDLTNLRTPHLFKKTDFFLR